MLQQTSCTSIVYQINLIANKLAMKYFSSKENEETKTSLEDAMLIYRILQSPKQIIIQSMENIDKAELASLYRKNSLRIHPDKCRHPQADQAFQKYVECYREVVNTLK